MGADSLTRNGLPPCVPEADASFSPVGPYSVKANGPLLPSAGVTSRTSASRASDATAICGFAGDAPAIRAMQPARINDAHATIMLTLLMGGSFQGGGFLSFYAIGCAKGEKVPGYFRNSRRRGFRDAVRSFRDIG